MGKADVANFAALVIAVALLAVALMLAGAEVGLGVGR